MWKVIKVVLLSVFLIFSICDYALAGSCTGNWGGDMKLSDNLKKILVQEIPIPVRSSDISEAGSFK